MKTEENLIAEKRIEMYVPYTEPGYDELDPEFVMAFLAFVVNENLNGMHLWESDLQWIPQEFRKFFKVVD